MVLCYLMICSYFLALISFPMDAFSVLIYLIFIHGDGKFYGILLFSILGAFLDDLARPLLESKFLFFSSSSEFYSA